MCAFVGVRVRAFYHHDLPDNATELTIDGEAFNHLKVVRLKVGEKLLLLDGVGGSCMSELVALEKKHAVVKTGPKSQQEASQSLDLAIGLVKKDALDLCLKMAVELDAGHIYLLESQFAQRYDINLERVQRLLIQALEQSNARWLPKVSILNVTDLVDNAKNYQHMLVMGMSTGKAPNELSELHGHCLGVIGPEGGFSAEEELLLSKQENALATHLPTPILRTPTALAALAGVIFTKKRLFH